MATRRDYYEILMVEKTASDDDIKRAYRKLAAKHHPDRNPGDEAAIEAFKEAAEAFDVLSNAEKRARYDRFGHAGVEGMGGGAGAGFGEVGDIMDAFGEMFAEQGHLGAMPATVCDGLWNIPASRHEAACASGSVAALAAMADLRAGNYDTALVLGVELEKTVHGDIAARHLGAAAWTGHEGAEAKFLWPSMFATVADEYDRRYGIKNKDTRSKPKLLLKRKFSLQLYL